MPITLRIGYVNLLLVSFSVFVCKTRMINMLTLMLKRDNLQSQENKKVGVAPSSEATAIVPKGGHCSANCTS